MRFGKIIGLLLFSSACLAPAAAADQLFEYRLQKLGVTSQTQACETEISAIAQRFTQQSGITPFAVGCSPDDFDRGFLNGVISYFADARLSVISSQDRTGTVDNDGAYRTLDQCQASLPRRVSQFQNIFGKEPLAAYCYQRHQYSQSFAALVEAIGESDIFAVNAGFYFYGRPFGEAAAVLNALRASAELKFPGRVMDASIDSSLGYVRATLRYFNDERVRLHNLDEMKFQTVEACIESLGTIEGIFTSFTDKPAALFCTTDGLAGIRANIVTFTMEIGAADNYTWYQAPSTYPSRAACLSGAGGMTSDRLAGSICTDTVPSVLHLILRNDG